MDAADLRTIRQISEEFVCFGLAAWRRHVDRRAVNGMGPVATKAGGRVLVDRGKIIDWLTRRSEEKSKWR